MVKRNPHIAKLNAGYLFPEINKRKKAFLETHPEAQLISLGIGDTTEPIPEFIVNSLEKAAAEMATPQGYHGYGPEQGIPELRQAIAKELYHNQIDAAEVFVSDGAKCDIGRLQLLFGSQAQIAVQDPSYPVYVDTSVILGQTQEYSPKHSHYQGITYLPCTPDNNFFPDLQQMPPSNLIYFCSPNNPTGAAATHEQLKQLVLWAKRTHSIIIYDAAYAIYIQDPNIPRSIYEIEGAKEVAIEVGSFSKMAGFTGIRLAWSIIPHELLFEDGKSVHKDWSRINSTFFNGASYLSQIGGCAALKPEGKIAMQEMVQFYLQNTQILRKTFIDMHMPVYGGSHAPYLWVKFPHQSSWQAFEDVLEKAHVICTPGSGFGPAGEGFLRFSAFGHRSHIQEAAHRLVKAFKDE